jgi:2-polyprenyl-3-methyl-5-hydroxy-6-metoxy-1,4-benzoquinol methylase
MKALKHGWTACGIEPNTTARENALRKGVHLEEDLQHYSDRTFEVITLWHVLEHIPNPQEYIRELTFRLTPGGLLFIAVPNFKSYDAYHYGKYWAAYDVPRHLSHFSRNSIQRIFLKIGFKVIDTKPMSFDSYYIALLSEKYKSGKSNYLKAFVFGLFSNLKAWKTREYSSILYVLKADGDLTHA